MGTEKKGVVVEVERKGVAMTAAAVALRIRQRGRFCGNPRRLSKGGGSGVGLPW